MISANTIKIVKSLQRRKFRQKYNKFIAEGHKTALVILQKNKYVISQVFASVDWIDANQHHLEEVKDRVVGVDRRAMAKITALASPSDVLIVLELPQDDLSLGSRCIYLDDVQDPGNVGTIIRVADWFGLDTVIRSEGSADFYNPKTIQASMGSFVNIRLMEGSLAEYDLSKHQVVAADMDGVDHRSIVWGDRVVLVMGSEGSGLSPSITPLAVDTVAISGAEGRVADSLNVAMAAGILCASMSQR